jgi:hypothetical protein
MELLALIQLLFMEWEKVKNVYENILNLIEKISKSLQNFDLIGEKRRIHL